MVDFVTYEDILDRMLLNVPDTLDKREGSVIYNALAPAAAELLLCYHQLQMLEDEVFADTASLEYLTKRCAERGISPKAATPAEVQAEFTPTNIDLINRRFAIGDVVYTATELVAPGEYKLTCETAGEAGNIPSGQLIPLEHIANLQTANITQVLIPGEDEEDEESLRQRYFDSFNSQAFGGNIADYKEKINALDGVGGVKVLPAWNGGGTVKLIIISSSYSAPSAALISSVQNAVDPAPTGTGMGLSPIGHKVTVAGAQSTSISISATITYASGYNWSSAQADVYAAIDSYFKEIAEAWADEGKSIVRTSQIEYRLLGLRQILDIQNLKINGGSGNIQLDIDKIPIRGVFNGA